MKKGFEDLISKVGECSRKTVAVAVAQDEPVLEAVKAAKERGIADAILVGDESKIKAVAEKIGMDLSNYKIIHESDDFKAAMKATELVHNKEANMLLKGLVDTKSFLKSVLNKEIGLRTGNPLSHVAVFELPGVDQLIFFSDAAFMTYPTLEDKVHIIENTVEVCHACGIECPKVAPVTAVEVVNPKMPETIEAAELTKMCEEGKIKGCIVDGPLSFDIAIDKEAAAHKGANNRKIAGDADMILCPNIHAANIAYKILVRTPGMKNGCLLTGTQAPVILTSRSDSFETKVNSIALGAVMAEAIK